MLKLLDISNFQSHKRTEIGLAAGLNCIIGSSDSGKSSVIRSLQWLATNRPRGTSFIRHGTKDACVVLDLSGQITITRHRDAQENKYLIMDADDKEEELTALAGGVPRQVTDALNMTEINWQSQFDKHFLVLDPPGQVAKAINDSVHLDDAANAVDRLSSRLRELSRDKAKSEQDVKDLTVKHGRYAFLPRYETDMEDATKLRDGVDRDGRLFSMLLELAGVETRLLELPDVSAEDADGLDILYCAWLDASSLAEKVRGASEDYAAMVTEVRRLDWLDDALDALAAVDGLCVGLVAVEGRLDGLSDMDVNLYDVDEDLKELDDGAAKLNSDLSSVMLELTECPTCGQELDDVARERMLG